MNPLRMSPQTIRVAGHRGHSVGAPENTLAAFRMARELGGAGVTCETDLAITRDGELILMHDDTVDRTTDGRGLVSNLTYAEVARLDAGRWFGEAFAGERVPRLWDALRLARELDIIYQLKLTIYDRDEALFAKLRALIDELDCADLLQFSSFDFRMLRDLKRAIPEVPTVGVSHSRWTDPAAIAREAKLDAISIEIDHFPSGEAKQLHDAGFAVVLGVPRPEALETIKAYGLDLRPQIVQWVRDDLADQIQSDDVALMADIKREANGL